MNNYEWVDFDATTIDGSYARLTQQGTAAYLHGCKIKKAKNIIFKPMN